MKNFKSVNDIKLSVCLEILDSTRGEIPPKRYYRYYKAFELYFSIHLKELQYTPIRKFLSKTYLYLYCRFGLLPEESYFISKELHGL